MILFLDKNNIDFNKIDEQSYYINIMLQEKRKLKKQLVSYMNKMTDAIDKIINPIDIDFIHKCLADLKSNLDKIDSHVLSLESLLNLLTSLKGNINDTNIEKYNLDCTNILNEHLNLNICIYNFMQSLLPYTSIAFPEVESLPEEKNCNEVPAQNKTEPENQNINSDLQENTLIISEKEDKVLLPFTMPDLEEKLKSEDSDGCTFEDIISKYYTLPLDIFKNAPLARFKEAFKLIKYKENGTLKAALDLGLELFFNSNLNPAIIAACRNLNELDIYLSYLEDAQVSNFKCFNIVYEYRPTVIVKPK